MTIIFPSNTAEVIDEMRLAIGRYVNFYTETKSGCWNCSIDPVTGNSTNPFDTVCSGTGYITTISGTSILAHITHKPLDNLNWVSGGKLMDGDAMIQIAYSDDNITLVSNCDYLEADSKRFSVKNTEYRGVPAINRILVTLVEVTE